MSIFNSLGSNYDFAFILQSLKKPNKNSKQKLREFLEKKYKGRVELTYKGRQAIELALKSLNLPEGSRIAVTGFTCIAVIEVIEKNNLSPVYLDIDPKTLNFTPQELEDKIKKESFRAAIIQNTLGYPCDIEEILKVCRKHKIVLIEDLAHSIGAIYRNGKEAGALGDLACLSFSQDKSIDAVSGGAIVIRNSKLKVQKSKLQLKNKNFSRDRYYPLFTFLIRITYPVGLGKILHFIFRSLHLLSDPMKNSNETQMPDWHAGLALYGFENLERTLAHRRKVAKVYADNLPNKLISNEIVKVINQGTNLRFPIFLENREKLIEYLKRRGVYISDIWYDGVVSPVKYLGLARYPKNSCPNSEKVSLNILNLPTHINTSEKDAYKICNLINKYVNNKKYSG
jgi:dTDP-4-amino-4,6-dideoxygalactose transaminase